MMATVGATKILLEPHIHPRSRAKFLTSARNAKQSFKELNIWPEAEYASPYAFILPHV